LGKFNQKYLCPLTFELRHLGIFAHFFKSRIHSMEEDLNLPFWKMKPEIVEYDKMWPILYEKEKEILLQLFGENVIDIQHFGSTSVEGMRAKPIVDISLALKIVEPSKEKLEILKNMGYNYRLTHGVPTSEYMRFDKGDPKVTHCLHLRAKQSIVAVATREYLKTHPEDAKRYGDTKLGLVSTNISMLQYREGKQSIISEIATKAMEWYEKQKQ